MLTELDSVCCSEATSPCFQATGTSKGNSQLDLTQEDMDDCGWHIRAAMLSAMLSAQDEYNVQATRALADCMTNELQKLNGPMLIERYHVLLRTNSESPCSLNNSDNGLFGCFIEPAVVEAMHFILPDGEADVWPKKAEMMRKCMISELQQLDCQKLVDQFMQIRAEYPQATGISRI